MGHVRYGTLPENTRHLMNYPGASSQLITECISVYVELSEVALLLFDSSGISATGYCYVLVILRGRCRNSADYPARNGFLKAGNERYNSLRYSPLALPCKGESGVSRTTLPRNAKDRSQSW